MRLGAPVTVVLLLAALAAPAHGTRGLPTVIQDDAAFLHGGDASVRAAMAQAAAVGMDRVRLSASWGGLTRDAQAPRRPAGFDARDPAAYEQWRWSALDRAVLLAGERGLAVLLDVAFWAPAWATAGDPADGPRPRTGIDPAAFADFAAAVARRYSGGFVPPGAAAPLPAIDAVALWNEPNHPAFLLPQYRRTNRGHEPASPHAYRAMVHAAYPAVKAVAPSMRVLIGNTSAIGGDGGRSPVAPLAFLRALACVDRALRPVTTGRCAGFGGRIPGDGWAHHPYAMGGRPDRPSPASRPDDARLADLPRMADLLRRLVGRGRLAPRLRWIYVTEFGYETEDVGDRPRLPEGDHARYLTWAEYVAARVPAVRMFAQFLLRDVPPAAVRQSDSPRRPYGEFSSGLWRADGGPKAAARTFVAGLFAQRTASGVRLWGRLRLGRRDRRVRVERSTDGGVTWWLVASLRVRGSGSFTLSAGHVPGALYRIAYRAEDGEFRPGLPVAPRTRWSARERPRPRRERVR